MNYKDINDYEVLYMIKDSDDDALELMLTKYKPLIDKKVYKWSAIFSKLGINQDDIRQELYYAFFKALKTYKEDNNTLFYTYVNILLDGHIKNILTSENKKNIVDYSLSKDISEDSQIIDFISDNYYSPEFIFDMDYLNNLFSIFSYDLKLEQSIIFEMYLSGYKVKQIAAVVDKKNNSVSVEINRILKKLKKNLCKNDYLVL